MGEIIRSLTCRFLAVVAVAIVALAVPAAAQADHNAVERISVGPTGGNAELTLTALAGGDPSDGLPSAVSDDGTIAYFRTSEKLVVGDTDSQLDIYRSQNGVTTLVSDNTSTLPDGDNASDFAGYGGASRDGTVLFFQTAEALLPADSDGLIDIYAFINGAPEIELVSTGPFTGPDFDASFKAVGKAGSAHFAVFETQQQLHTADTDTVTDVYIRDITNDVTFPVSDGVNPTGPAVNFAGVAQNGSRVFLITADALEASDTNGGIDLYEKGIGISGLLSANDSGTSPGHSLGITFGGASADGTRVFFQTSEQLEGTDTDSAPDVYERVGGGAGSTNQISSGNAAQGATFGGVSDDGLTAYYSTLEAVTSDDDDITQDIYSRISSGTTTLISDNNDDCVGCDSNFDATLGNGTFGSRDLQFAVSTDGARAFFYTDEQLDPVNDTDGGGNQDVYERNGSTLTLVSDQVDSAAPDPPIDAFFGGASEDGTAVGIVTSESLTADDLGGPVDGFIRRGGMTVLATGGSTGPQFSVASTVGVGASRDARRYYFHTIEKLSAEDTDSQIDVYYGSVDGASGTVSSGAVSTGGAATETDPVEASVTPPGGGSVQISENHVTTAAPVGYTLLGYQTAITVTPNTTPTSTNPIVITFRIDSSLLPANYNDAGCHSSTPPAGCVPVFRNGTAVDPFCDTPGVVDLAGPCVNARTQSGGAGGDLEITVLTLSASNWNFGIAPASLTVVKDAMPNDAQDFAFTADGHLSPTSFSLDDDSNGTLSNSRTFSALPAGDGYSVTETLPAGWVQASATCSDGSPVTNIDLSSGESVTCTFSNTPQASIVIKKDVQPGTNGQDFTFTAGGGLSPTSFQLDDDPSDGTLSDTRTFTNVAPGSYSVSENSVAGWGSSPTCDDGSSAGNISVSTAEIVTCTFINTLADPNYSKPINASPLRIPLIVAFGGCTSGNSTHGAPLDFPSCNPPSPSSGTVKTGTGSVGQAWVIVCNTASNAPSCNESAGGFTSSLRPDLRIFGANRDTQCRLTGIPSGCSAGSDYNPNGATGPYTTTCTTAATCGNDGRPPLCAPGVGSSTACFAGSDVTLVQALGDPSGTSVDPSTQCGTDASCLAFASRFVGHGLRVTDRYNCDESLPAGDPNECPASPSTSTRAATLIDISFPVPLDCLGTASAALGSTCGVNTTANALVPGFVLAGKQGVVELGEITLRDSGPDGTRGNTDDERFATQGIFLP